MLSLPHSQQYLLSSRYPIHSILVFKMPGERILLPRPAVAGDSRAVETALADAEGPTAGQQGRGKERRYRHTAQEWEDVKENFKALYFQEDISLDDVKQEMGRRGFGARCVRYSEIGIYYFSSRLF